MLKKYEKVLEQDYRSWYKTAEAYRKKVAEDPDRLHFHLMPKTGWLNDPNGLCQVDGMFHIYYQYTPFEPTGELKLWGHYKTRDFIHYIDDGPVLFPDTDYDAHGVYSGSAYVENGRIHFFYTGNVKYFDREDYDYINSGRGSNTMTCTSLDGHQMSEKKFLFGTEDYPKDLSNHVRDPKVFCRGDYKYMVLGARDRDSRGLVLLYQSEDLEHWTLKSRITTREPFGYMWECPDMFEIDGQWFLTCCPQGVDSRGIDYENVHKSVWMKLECDFETGNFEVQEIHQLDRGFDFYAQQTFEDEKGRRILIGWMGIPDAEYTNPTVEAGWQHGLTLPRELTVRNGKLCQQPVEELKELRDGNGETCLFSNPGGESALLDDSFVYEAEVELESCESLQMTLRDGVTFCYEDHRAVLDLGKAGSGRTTRSAALDSLRNLRIFADTSSVEIFINDGEEVFTSRMYSREGRVSLSGACRGKMTLYPLKKFTVEDLEA